MKRSGAFLVAALLCAASPAQTLPELFQKAKAEVKSGSWSAALQTLDALDAEAARPGNEAARQKLAAPTAFYRGVCEANLGNAEKAKADFATFRELQPDASIDASMYSKKAVAAFEAASGDAPSGGALSLSQRFEKFKSPPNMGEKPDDRWADGPAKWIMTPEEKTAWAGLTAGAERAEFVEKFWERRNPKPGSDDNIARNVFDRRVAFADAYFQLDEQRRGSLTDAGMVFVLLGPPSWTGRKPIVTGEDPTDAAGMGEESKWWMAARNSVHVDGTKAADPSGGFREIWHYRREALPNGVSASQVNVVFITKKGYGRSVLQREPATLSALDAARPGRSENY
jgi:GWxTD domain-containing protein